MHLSKMYEEQLSEGEDYSDEKDMLVAWIEFLKNPEERALYLSSNFDFRTF